MTEPLIKIQNLHKEYPTPAGALSVLRGINLDIHKGDFAAVIGASGSGKTTFLNMLTAVDQPTRGTVTIGGVNISQTHPNKLTRWRATNVGIIFQFFQLLPTLTVVQNVIAPMDLANVGRRSERKAVATRLLNQLGIGDQAMKTPDMLSGGQQQRVAIARALANNPPLIIGDEPTGNLDRMSAHNVFNIFRELADQGATVVIVTYDRELVRDVPVLLELHEGTLRHTTVEQVAKHRTQELQQMHA